MKNLFYSKRFTLARFKVKVGNATLRLISKFSNQAIVECPCCGWVGNKFCTVYGGDRSHFYVRKDAECPGCGALERHRSLFLYLMEIECFKNWQGTLIHFAPERALASLLRQYTSLSWFSIDLAMPNVSIRADIMHIPLRTASVTYVLCSHVLEHVPNDRQALQEVSKCLKLGGILYCMVPIFSQRETVEYGRPLPEDSDHWRQYGEDFKERISMTGFEVQRINFAEIFHDSVLKRYGLCKGEVFRCTKKDS